MILIVINITSPPIDLAMDNLGVADAKIPASGQVNLTDGNTIDEIRNDSQLKGYIQNDQVKLNNGTADILKSAALNSILNTEPAKLCLISPTNGKCYDITIDNLSDPANPTLDITEVL